MAKQSRHLRSSLSKKGPSFTSSYWAGAIAIFILVTLIAVRLFGDQLYDYPEVTDRQSISRNAVIVCLAGGRGRIHAALNLLASGIGSELFIVGAGPKTNVPAILHTILAEPDTPKLSPELLAKIALEKDSRNTIENAYAVENFLRQNPGVHEIVLITSAYHMRRSLLVMQSLIRKDVHITAYSPPKEAIEKSNWWQSWLGAEVTMVEYSKYLLAKILIPNLSYF